MRLVLNLSMAALISLVIGIGSAILVVDFGGGLATIAVGPWIAQRSPDPAAADPYTAAIAAGVQPFGLGSSEGIALVAETDSAGDPLSGRCTYIVSGEPLSARLWTLTAYDADGRLMDNPSQRHGFHSAEILLRADGGFDIAISASPEPGNWLPVTPAGPIRLVLRLYDTPLTGPVTPAGPVPAITRSGCP